MTNFPVISGNPTDSQYPPVWPSLWPPVYPPIYPPIWPPISFKPPPAEVKLPALAPIPEPPAASTLTGQAVQAVGASRSAGPVYTELFRRSVQSMQYGGDNYQLPLLDQRIALARLQGASGTV
jgi:hypothetical protein